MAIVSTMVGAATLARIAPGARTSDSVLVGPSHISRHHVHDCQPADRTHDVKARHGCGVERPRSRADLRGWWHDKDRYDLPSSLMSVLNNEERSP